MKAFARLAKKLKSSFPRLPICIVGDGLYPNQNVFEICKGNNWEWIFTLKEGSLPSVWEDLATKLFNCEIKYLEDITKRSFKNKKNNNKLITKKFIQNYSWSKNLDYKGECCHWASVIETIDGEIIHNFVYLTSFLTTNKTIREIIKNGRLRFKIENEGFNAQKNLGYSLRHKYSESSELATKNYYTCLQIAHMINQVFELSTVVKAITSGRNTILSLWEFIRGVFSLLELNTNELAESTSKRLHVSFD